MNSNDTLDGQRTSQSRVYAALDRIAPFALTVVFAGLGHFYLRYWFRGTLWAALYSFSLLFLSDYSPGFESAPFEVFVVSAVSTLEPADIVFPAAFLVLALVDVYLLRIAE